MKLIDQIKKYQNFLIAALAFAAMFYGIREYSLFETGLTERKIRGKLLETLIYKKSQLEKSLYSRIYYTKSVAAYISVTPENSTNAFYQIAEEFLKHDSVISTMALSKDCIIGAIYPLPGHEKAIGLNLLAHPKRREIVERTIQTKNTFVAGPVELIEGGIAFISYTPIFSGSAGRQSFWGVTDIVIYRDKLFNEAGLKAEDENFRYALRGIDGTGNSGRHFWGDSLVFSQNPVSVEISLPTGTWSFASSPKIGWKGYISQSESPVFIYYTIAFIIAVLIWLLTNALSKIRQNEKELKALFGSMRDIVIVFNRKGEYVRIAPTNEDDLVRPRKELLGKTLWDIFKKDYADFTFAHIQRCFDSKELVVYDYPIDIRGEQRWFEARISYIADDAVIFVAHDNTQQKLQADILVESEQKLKRLNETKDKFFSIIAHDLRSPFHGLLNLSDIMAHESKDFTKEEFVRFSEALHTSADNLFKLLNNLLDWSLVQRGTMRVEKKLYPLNVLVLQAIEPLLSRATQKEILIERDVPADALAFCDEKMIVSVMRNLISNAVKFTPRGGRVRLSAKINAGRVEVTVEDNGVGIAQKDIGKLFQVGEKISSKGTEDETGTGLGLILCREFVEKNGGSIKAESREGHGAVFQFSLPAAE